MDIEGGTGGVWLGRDEPRQRTAHPALCHAKAAARPQSLGGKTWDGWVAAGGEGAALCAVGLGCQRRWQRAGVQPGR